MKQNCITYLKAKTLRLPLLKRIGIVLYCSDEYVMLTQFIEYTK